MSVSPAHFFCLGTNHKYAPLEFRESLYLEPDSIVSALPHVRSNHGLNEIAVLSTCNRFEMYGVSDQPPKEGFDCLGHAYLELQERARKSLPVALGDLESNGFCYTGEKAISHMFQVASSLDSLVVGETQITGQFKNAIQLARRAETLGPHLNFLSQEALSVAKKVRVHTDIGKRTVSMGHAALQLAKQVFRNLNEQRILILGAGEIAQVTALHAIKYNPRDIYVVNRSLPRAEALVEQLGRGQTGELDELPYYLSKADVVIAGSACDDYLLTETMVKDALLQRKNKSMFMVDLSLPRNIDPGISKYDEVYLFELDDLKQVVNENLFERQQAAESAQDIIEHSIELFRKRLAQHSMAQALGEFKGYLDSWVNYECKKTLSRKLFEDLNQDQKEALERLHQSLSSKLTSSFARTLKELEDPTEKVLLKQALKSVQEKVEVPVE